MKQKMRSLGSKLSLQTYARDKMFVFTLASKSRATEDASESVSVPIPIMFRYWHIGRAYDLHQLKNLHPTGAGSTDFVSMQLLISELEQINDLIADPVLHHYGNLLLSYLKAARTDTQDRLVFRAA